jgi:hypothetical protein
MAKAHIILYSDEMDHDAWVSYCETAGVCPSASELIIVFDTKDVKSS